MHPIDWIEGLLSPFKYEFFRNGLMAATMVGALCGLIGVVIVLKKMSYIGHGLSHSVFGGAVVSYVMGINFYIGAGLWGFLSALLINAATRKRKIGADAAIGIVTTASFAIGVAIISSHRGFTRNFDAALFGNILGVSVGDLFIIGAVLLVAMVAVFFGYKQLLFSTFDPEVAPAYGVPIGWVDTFFSLVLAATIIASMQVMGVTLIAASIVIPSITARMLTDSFARMLILSSAIGAGCGLLGMYLSYFFNISSGAAIVLFSALVFLLVLARGWIITGFKPSRRPAWQRRLSAQEASELYD
jgi:manganese/iron transport system permease protein/iron/zinc/copper transport system permease protein